MPIRWSRNGLLIGAVSALLFLLYLFRSTQNYTYADDSLPFAWLVHHGGQAIVHHLVLLLLHRANQWLGFTEPADFARSIELFKCYIAASSALAMVLIGVLTLRWFGSLRAALATMLFVGFTYGYWCYSIVPDLYVPAIAFTLLAIYFADKSYEAAAARAGDTFVVLSAVSVLLASINHQAHSLIVIPIAGVLLLARRGELPWGLRIRRAAIHFTTTGILGLVTYYGVYRAASIPGGFITFIRGYEAWMPRSPWDGLQWRTPVYAVMGITRALVFPELALHFNAAYERMHRVFPIKILFDDRYLTRTLSGPTVALLLVLASVLLLAFALVLARSLWLLRREPPRSPGGWMLFHWVGVQTLFFAAWEPTSNEFWIWLLPCLAIFGVGPLLRGSPRGPRAALAWALPLALLLVNLPVVSRYWSRDNCIYRVNKTYLPRLDARDLPLTRAAYGITFLEHLEAPAIRPQGSFEGTFSLADTALQRRLGEVRASGGRVVLDPMLVSPEDSENRLQVFLAHCGRDSTVRELLRLESFCAENRIALLAVARRGSSVLRFEPCPFAGYARWVDDRLNPLPAGVNSAP